MYAVEQVCGLYGVQCTREQSRTFNVQGAAGRWRPLFIGQWTDSFGKIHRQGRADFLARPRIRFDNALIQTYVSIPLWIECKSITGRQTPDQAAFQRWVQANGDYYMLLREDVRPLMTWFDEHGVVKHVEARTAETIVKPPTVDAVQQLPCRWCGQAKAEHIGQSLGCPPIHVPKKWLGKTWKPDIRSQRGDDDQGK
jgi:hypothetical protein